MAPIDFIDQAQDIVEKSLAESIQKRTTLTLPFSGFCLCCEEPVKERRFCDSLCREQYERDRSVKKRQ